MGNGSRSRRREEALAAGAPDPGNATGDPDDEAAAAHRAHKARQRRRKTERRHAAVDAILSRLRPPPGDDVAFGRMEETPAWAGGDPAPIDWPSMGPSCDPASMTGDGDERSMVTAAPSGGGGPEGDRAVSLRAMRKRWQVDSFAVVLRELERARAPDAPPLRVVDFGAGSGNLTLPLAKRFPTMRFVAVEMKRRSADLLLRRARAAGLSNLTAHVGMIETSTMPFDVGLALHACGNATDHAILRCVAERASFVVSPCCIGKLKFSLAGGSSFSATNRDWTTAGTGTGTGTTGTGTGTGTVGDGDGDGILCAPVITHPRSRWMASQLPDSGDFAALAVAADTGHGNGAAADRITDLGRRAKIHVELDRAQGAREAGYDVVTLSVVRGEMAPPNKSHLIVGVPGGVDEARAVARLRVGGEKGSNGGSKEETNEMNGAHG